MEAIGSDRCGCYDVNHDRVVDVIDFVDFEAEFTGPQD